MLAPSDRMHGLLIAVVSVTKVAHASIQWVEYGSPTVFVMSFVAPSCFKELTLHD